MTERRYSLVRIGTGDYLTLSNDGRTLWRVSSYREDGDAITWRNGREVPLLGTFWQCAYCELSPEAFERMANRDPDFDTESWEHWRTYETTLRTRGEAIESALRADVKRKG